MLHKRLRLYAYKVQLLQAWLPTDRRKRAEFAIEMLHRINDDKGFLQTDEANFLVSGHMKGHNVRICGSETPHKTLEMERDSPKVNVWCGLMHNRIVGPFFFKEKTVNGSIYLYMLERFSLSKLQDFQYGAPPHWYTDVRTHTDKIFPNRRTKESK